MISEKAMIGEAMYQNTGIGYLKASVPICTCTSVRLMHILSLLLIQDLRFRVENCKKTLDTNVSPGILDTCIHDGYAMHLSIAEPTPFCCSTLYVHIYT